jgi:hypothetical protein
VWVEKEEEGEEEEEEGEAGEVAGGEEEELQLRDLHCTEAIHRKELLQNRDTKIGPR